MSKRTIIDVTEPVLTLKMETGEVRIFILRDANYRMRNHSVRDTSPNAYWHGPALVEERDRLGYLSVVECWPDQPQTWHWLEALAQIGLWDLGKANVPRELQAYWHKGDRELPALYHADPNRSGCIDGRPEEGCTTKDVFWSCSYHCYVLVEADDKAKTCRLWHSGGRRVWLVSLNDGGQIRCEVTPADVKDWQSINPNHEYIKAATHFGLQPAEEKQDC